MLRRILPIHIALVSVSVLVLFVGKIHKQQFYRHFFRSTAEIQERNTWQNAVHWQAFSQAAHSPAIATKQVFPVSPLAVAATFSPIFAGISPKNNAPTLAQQPLLVTRKAYRWLFAANAPPRA